MSRSGYTDEADNIGLYRANVARSVRGKRGQALLRELLDALDAMPKKELHQGSFATPDGEFCALGVVAKNRGIDVSDLGDDDYCEIEDVGKRFGISSSLAAEIMYLNDEYFVDSHKWVYFEICGPMRPYYPDHGKRWREVSVLNLDHASERWQAMRDWCVENLAAKVPV